LLNFVIYVEANQTAAPPAATPTTYVAVAPALPAGGETTCIRLGCNKPSVRYEEKIFPKIPCSGSVHLGVDPDPDHAIFVIDLQDASKKLF
jgi:hypothetical protein